jgi:putative ABC transport system permease protein
MRARLLRLAARCSAWLRSSSLDRDLDDELRSHIEMLTDDHVRSGMAPIDAGRAARLQLGAMQPLAEQHRRIRGVPALDAIWRDLRIAWRSTIGRPIEAAPTVLTLALGIGVVTALFSMLDSAIWHRTPFRDADQLVEVWSHIRNGSSDFIFGSATREQVLAWQRQHDLFEWVEAYGPATFVTQTDRQATVVRGAVVTPALFDRLGASARLGRVFTKGDGQAGSNHRIVISDAFWTSAFQRDPAVVGAHVTVNQGDYQVVGVMPASFRFPDARARLWVPYDVVSPPPTSSTELQSAVPTMIPLARLKGLSFDDADARVKARGDAVNASAGTAQAMGADLVRFERDVSVDTKHVFLLLAGAGLLVLLIVCVNVAALTLARDLARSSAIATRAALGASRGALIRESLVYHLLIGLLGVAAGTSIAFGLLHAVLRLLPTSLTDATLNPAGLNGRALGFAIAAGTISGLLAGLPSALSASGVPVLAVLRRNSRTAASSRWGARVRTMLVGAQVCLSLVLLLGAGLMTSTVVRLYRADRGFNPNGLVAVTIGFPRAAYPDANLQQAFTTRARDAAARVRGVTAAAVGSIPPDILQRIIGPIDAPGGKTIDTPMRSIASLYAVSPNYFDTLGIAILNGRTFRDDDPDDAVIVSATFARLLWQGTSIAGQRFRIGNVWHTVVGVVDDVHHVSVAAGTAGRSDPPQVYYRHGRTYDGGLAIGIVGQSILAAEDTLAVRISDDASAASVQAAVSRLDPAVVVRVETADAMIADEIARSRVVFVLMAGFAVLALTICVAGLYGLVSYGVEQRRREIGIRLALGERPFAVGRRVVARTLLLTAASIVIGLALSAALIGLLRSELYGVSPSDPATALGAALVLALAAIVGAALPAGRAMRTDPSTLLRGE